MIRVEGLPTVASIILFCRDVVYDIKDVFGSVFRMTKNTSPSKSSSWFGSTVKVFLEKVKKSK